MRLFCFIVATGIPIFTSLNTKANYQESIDYHTKQIVNIQLSQTQSEMQCLHDCITKYGDASKASCTRTCGLSAIGSRKNVDCGIQYKTCLNNCDSNSECKKECRHERVKCI